MRINSLFRSSFMTLVLASIMIACGGPKELMFDESGLIADLEAKPFHRSLLQSLEKGSTFEFRGKASYVSSTQDVSFRYTVRIKKDSLIWIDITDPFLGLKVARALVFPDSAVLYNRFESSWMAGGIALIQEHLQLGLSFNHLQSIFLGEPIYMPATPKDLSIQPAGSQIDVEVEGLEEDPLFMFDLAFYDYSFIMIPDLPLMSQYLQDGPRSIRVLYTYENEDPGIPRTIKILMNWESEVVAELEHTEVSRDIELNVPFNIPNGYERVE